MTEPAGKIFNTQHFCLHDGPGIRTVLFFKGCSLHCLWCHNPEGISTENLLSFDRRKCRNCGACVNVCPAVHKIGEQGHYLDRSACSLKGECAAVCIPRALEIVGRDRTAKELIAEVLRDTPYYDNSGGGVTISGGEPTLQSQFLLTLVRGLKREKLHIALETNGFCDYGVYEPVLPHVDLFLYDYKETDPELHRKYTGVSNELILENLSRLSAAGAKILLRCPVIPGLNDSEDHFRGIAAITGKYPNLEGAEILPYHNLSAVKTGLMGLEDQKMYPRPPQDLAKWIARIREYGGRVVNPAV
ncbi:MAG: glycyl-radical enzyme activating protein [Treponema sp.]|jgi:pyruvate formate lyase activating enzyme|nr:glycyl-radical enzyme activating protein [Treponema sp.]